MTLLNEWVIKQSCNQPYTKSTPWNKGKAHEEILSYSSRNNMFEEKRQFIRGRLIWWIYEATYIDVAIIQIKWGPCFTFCAKQWMRVMCDLAV